MIERDEPKIFPDVLNVYVSSKSDGNLLDRSVGVHNPAIVTNRTAFCEKNGFSYGDVVYQRIIYDDRASYSLIADVDKRSTTEYTSEVVADALFTKYPDVGLMLPIADCVPTVVFDPVNKYLALAHMGRHSTLTDLLAQLVSHFEMHGSDPTDLLVWMGPSAQRQSYRMDYFDHEGDPAWQNFFDKKDGGYYLDLQGFNKQKLVYAGVKPDNIEISPIDTVTDSEYFSHFAGDTVSRFATVVMMRSDATAMHSA